MQCFGTSFFGRIDHLASSVIKFRPKNSVPKHCIRSITYKYKVCVDLCGLCRYLAIFSVYLVLQFSVLNKPIVYMELALFSIKKCWNEKAEKKHVLDQFYCL